MKLLRSFLAVAGLLAATISAKALPIFEADAVQYGRGLWFIDIGVNTVNAPGWEIGLIHIDGIPTPPSEIHQDYDLPAKFDTPLNMYNSRFQMFSFVLLDYELGHFKTVGTHTISRVFYQGDTEHWVSYEYTIVPPTTDAPEVPDAGATAALLAGSLMGLVLLRGRHRFKAASAA